MAVGAAILTALKTAGAWIVKHPVKAAQVVGIAKDAADLFPRFKKQPEAASDSSAPLTLAALQQQITTLEATVQNDYNELNQTVTDLKQTIGMLSFDISELEANMAQKMRIMTVFLVLAYVALIAGIVLLFVL